jgi:hypothetical protein
MFKEEWIEIGICCSLSNKEPIKEGTSDLLKKQLVEEKPISPIPTQINDVLVN